MLNTCDELEIEKIKYIIIYIPVIHKIVESQNAFHVCQILHKREILSY